MRFAIPPEDHVPVGEAKCKNLDKLSEVRRVISP